MKFAQLSKQLLKNYKLTIIVTVCILLVSYLVYQIYFDKPQYVTVRVKGSPGNWWWVTPRPPDWLAESVHIGDKEFNAMNKATAEVLSKEIYDAGGTSKDVFLTVKIETKYNKRTGKYTYKGEPVQVGGPISLNLNKTFFPGMVVDIYGDKASKRQYVDTVIKVRHSGKWPWEYDAIKVGETISDGNGTVIAEIIDKEKKQAEKETVDWQGQIVQAYSPMFIDAFITVKLKAEKKEDGLVFRQDQYLKLGNNVWLLFPSYNISGALIFDIK